MVTRMKITYEAYTSWNNKWKDLPYLLWQSHQTQNCTTGARKKETARFNTTGDTQKRQVHPIYH